MSRLTRAGSALIVLLAVSGCAGHARPQASVRLSLAGPVDGTTVTTATVTLSGRVAPDRATVLIGGRRVAVRSGRFTAPVALAPGANVVDVLAGARGDHAAATALRITRQVFVSVPDVTGEGQSQATATLGAAGLSVRVYRDTNPLRFFLLPLPTQVCATVPAAHTRVSAGSVVSIQLGKLC